MATVATMSINSLTALIDSPAPLSGNVCGSGPEAVAASPWKRLCPEYAPPTRRRGLVVTLPRLGDLEPGQTLCHADLLCQRPLVTWHPAGRTEDRFCLMLISRPSVCKDSEAGSRLLWLVTDISGTGDCLDGGDDDAGGGSDLFYGFAGNCDAVSHGREVVCYEAPGPGVDLLLLLFQQPVSGSCADLSGVGQTQCSLPHREGFCAIAFAESHGLGGVVAGELAATAQTEILSTSTLEPVSAQPVVSKEGMVLTKRADALDNCYSVHADPSGMDDFAEREMGDRHKRPEGYSDGGPLCIEHAAPTQLAAALCRTADDCSEKGLTIYDTNMKPQRLTFAQLWSRAVRLSCGLRRLCVHGNDQVMFQIPSLSDHFATFWGCILGRVKPVAVAIPPSYEDSGHAVCMKICNTWQLLHGPLVVTTASHAPKLESLRSVPSMACMHIATVEDLDEPNSDIAEDPRALALAIDPADVAFYQLSSGSTGVPKCIQIAHRGVVAHIHGEAQFCNVSRDDVHLSFLPVDHVVPILTVHCCDVYHGCEEVQLEVASVVSEPLQWLRLLHEHRATRTWSPNFAFKLVADALRGEDTPVDAFDLSSCRYWMNAGEQVTIPVCEEFLDRVRSFGVQRNYMQPAFGMAESCTCMTYNNEYDQLPASRVGRSTFVNLGRPVPGVEIRITNEENCIVPEETVGRFQIRGAVITPGYKHNAKANEEAFVGDGWFNSGDLGFIKDGRLYLTGREKEMIIIRGANFYCHEIEDVVNALPSVLPTFSAAVSAHDPASGSESFAVFVVPSHPSSRLDNSEAMGALVKAVRMQLVKHMSLTPSQVVPLRREEFPKTTSGKIQRGQLMRALRAGEYETRLAALAM
eukprot:TRINITY_DN44218_c0_g1_i1.p1 TRINITY_DN44218_c0_g1~~TRINITY_DN44218_c0_g1_i1.p1  ORF type:complete len:862 (-),score=84.74 TRINITY_DN44218_c0_g1_i1:96-2681(-)